MNKKVTAVLAVIFILVLVSAVQAVNETKIFSDNGQKGDEFGRSVSVSGDYAIVGAYKEDDKEKTDSGAAYIFRRDGNSWIQQARLVPDDSVGHEYFGHSVSINSNGSEWYAIVGAFGYDKGDELDTGSAYIFKGNNITWTQQAKLTAEDGSGNDYFGWSVAISGGYAVVGAYRDDDKGDESGSAYIFKRDRTSWIQQAKLTADDGAADDNFGRSVSISGSGSDQYAIMGAIHDDDKGNNSGSAYIFKHDGTSWSQQAKLTADDGAADDYFGFSVSISGVSASKWCAIVGAESDDDKGNNSGAAYVFRSDGDTWTWQAKLTPADGSAGDHFGRSVSVTLQGTHWYAISGADASDGNENNSGAAYIFKSDGASWIQEDKLTAADGASEDNFGWSVCITSHGSEWYAVTGTDANDHRDAYGSAYIYSNRFLPDIDVAPTTVIINKIQSGPGNQRTADSASDSGFRDSDQTPDREYAKGLIIPEDVIKYWKDRIRPPRTPVLSDLPSSMDWSQYDSPAKQQGNCGSCWAFATVSLLENLVNQAGLSQGQDLSEHAVTSCSLGGCGGGWYWDAFNYIHKNGIPSESCSPYDPSDLLHGQDNKCEKCTDQDFLIKIKDFTPSPGLWGEDHTKDDLRQALQNGPLCVSMRVPDDGSFNGQGYTGGVYDYNGGHISWDSNGHAVLLVGYDDNLQCFKVKNSWGENWGENGYFRIAYDDVTDDVKFGSYACSASGIFVVGKPVTLKNSGVSNLVINNISADKPWLTFSPHIIRTIHPNEQQAITISIADWNSVAMPEETGRITISSNDPDEPSVVIEVTAVRGAGVHNIPVLLVSPPFYEIPRESGISEGISISNGGEGRMEWTAKTDDTWLTIVSGTQGTDDGKIIFSYKANNGDERTGKIIISAPDAEENTRIQIIEIRQSGQVSITGDIDDSGITDLADAILALKVLSGINIGQDCADADVNGDNKIGMEEAIFALEIASEIR